MLSIVAIITIVNSKLVAIKIPSIENLPSLVESVANGECFVAGIEAEYRVCVRKCVISIFSDSGVIG